MPPRPRPVRRDPPGAHRLRHAPLGRLVRRQPVADHPDRPRRAGPRRSRRLRPADAPCRPGRTLPRSSARPAASPSPAPRRAEPGPARPVRRCAPGTPRTARPGGTARTVAQLRRATAISGARSSTAGLVLSTTTSRPAPSSSSTTRRWRSSRRRALGQWSLLTTVCESARWVRTQVLLPQPCSPTITTSSTTVTDPRSSARRLRRSRVRRAGRGPARPARRPPRRPTVAALRPAVIEVPRAGPPGRAGGLLIGSAGW